MDTLEELHVAEEELRQSNAELSGTRNSLEAERYRYQQLFDFAPGGYLVTDPLGMIREANQAASALLGIRPEKLVGKPLGPYIHMDEHDQFRQHLTQLNKTDQTRQWETTLVSRQKEPIPVSLTAAATRGPDGTLTSLRWLLHDTTEQVRAKNKLQESESKWRSLTETSPDHILTLDKDLNIEFANFASPGLTVEDLMGTPLYAYLEEARQAEVKAILEEVINTGQNASYETTYLNPDGGTIYYEIKSHPQEAAGKQ